MQPRKLKLHHINDDQLPVWPATWGVPFKKGELLDPNHLQLSDGDGRRLPIQFRCLTTHDDGSVRRGLITTETPLAPATAKEFVLQEGEPGPAESQPVVSADSVQSAAGKITATDVGLKLETIAGEYELSFRGTGCIPESDASVEAKPLEWKFTELECIHAGEVEALCVLKGDFYLDGQEFLQTRLTLRSYAKTPVVLCDFLVLNLTEREFIQLDQLEAKLARKEHSWSDVSYEVRQSAMIHHATLPIEVQAHKLKLRFEDSDGEREHTSRLLNLNETWFALADGQSRTVLGIPNFFEYFPYGVRLSRNEACLDFWPAWSEKPLELKQGAGKTHQFGLAFVEADSSWTERALGYAIGKPPMARTPVTACQQGGVFEELLEHQPDTYPRTETTLFDLAYNRNRGYGKMNWGDDYSALYTNQLRGKGEIVWNNLEGDHPFHVWRQFVRTGLFQYFKDYRDSMLHWADVDFCDYNSDPLNSGALRLHSAGHWSGRTSPCHNWAEGFREWYFATGDPRPKEILEKMGNWIVRRAEAGAFKTDPQPYTRGCGWGLIQMAAMQEVLGRADIRQIMLQLCGDLLDYCREKNGLTMAFPTGGSWLPRDNAFHTATVVMGAYHTWKLYEESVAEELITTASESFMDERTCTPEGIAVYISGPEQSFPMQQAAGFAMAGLACAYYTTGEERYVRRGMRMLEYCLDRGMIVDQMRIPGEFTEIGDDVILNVMMLMPNTQLLSYQMRGILLFMKAAHETGMLEKVDYQF
ncbi:MAG: hypothetical protein QF473_13860 [Planctomycetota bacterium]|nr:hypothetical protein [Planctomycetota bacterium]MDP6501981.1 hypothetical protein [Planctomycetota bacterium]